MKRAAAGGAFVLFVGATILFVVAQAWALALLAIGLAGVALVYILP